MNIIPTYLIITFKSGITRQYDICNLPVNLPYPVQASYSPRSTMYSGNPPAIRSPVLLDSDAPPPPPPKPSSHEASRRGTPQLSSPFLRPLQQSSQSLDGDRYYQSDSQAQCTISSIGTPGLEQDPRDPGTQISALPEPPSVEDGWLPDIVKDKS